MASLIDKNGSFQIESAKSAEVLNNQFVSAYTHADTESIPHKGSRPYPSMQKIKVNRTGVAKLLRDLKPYKASGPDSIPLAADEISPVLSKIF